MLAKAFRAGLRRSHLDRVPVASQSTSFQREHTVCDNSSPFEQALRCG